MYNCRKQTCSGPLYVHDVIQPVFVIIKEKLLLVSELRKCWTHARQLGHVR